MEYSTILYETDAGKARVTLNRPEKLNAISWQMQQELQDALWAADRDPHVHVVILRGAGRTFSAGYDITPPPGELTHAASAHSMERDIWYLEQAQQMRMAVWDMHKPVIGQVHGYCLAGGTDLVFLCDIVIAAEDAQIGFPPVRAMGSPVGLKGRGRSVSVVGYRGWLPYTDEKDAYTTRAEGRARCTASRRRCVAS